MKKGIHPPYREFTVHCGCGNEFLTRSTYVPTDMYGDILQLESSKKNVINVTICDICHPEFRKIRGEKPVNVVPEDSPILKFDTKYDWQKLSALKKQQIKDEENKREQRRMDQISNAGTGRRRKIRSYDSYADW
ncbi:MAG: 50S ribosomal protein L31 [Candidatus Aenigmarchaeota archaeon]|nr:50S ribosomal protein L31 [Candidatus Aenigmarchaeota archaeon]